MPECVFQIDLPAAIAASALYASGGFVIIPDLLASEALEELAAEAFSARSTGQRNIFAFSDGTEGRGGAPGRAFTSANGRDVQWRLFSSPAVLRSLANICGIAAAPSGGGTYTYYDQPGDFLALHRDVVSCDLAVITCLADIGLGADGGGLMVYPGYTKEPLSRVREAGRAAAVPVPLSRGETVALLGGIVPHEVAPMPPGRERIVSVMCCRVAGDQFPAQLPAIEKRA